MVGGGEGPRRVWARAGGGRRGAGYGWSGDGVVARGAGGRVWCGAGLVDENELVGIDEGLRRPPDAAPGGDVRTVWRRGVF